MPVISDNLGKSYRSLLRAWLPRTCFFFYSGGSPTSRIKYFGSLWVTLRHARRHHLYPSHKLWKELLQWLGMLQMKWRVRPPDVARGGLDDPDGELLVL